MSATLNYFIDLRSRTSKKIKWNGQRRGESLYIEAVEGSDADIYAIWSHNPALAKKAKESFKRRFYAPQYGWPWEQIPSIKDVLSIVGTDEAQFAAPYLPQPTLPDQTVEKAAPPPSRITPLSIVLEYHGFAEYPIVHVFASFKDAWSFVQKHPATIDFLSKAKIGPEKINYFEYENLADKLATRTMTTFKIHNQPVK